MDQSLREAAGAEAPPKESLMKPRVSRGADLNTPRTPLESMKDIQSRKRPGQGALTQDNPEEDASEQEQAEHDRAIEGLHKVLYADERTSESIAMQLTPEEKIGSIAKTSLRVVTELDKKMDLDEVVIPELTQETVSRVVEIYETTHGEELTDRELQSALGAAWEGVMEMYGITEDDYAEMTAGMSDEEFQGYQSQYQDLLGD